MSVRDPKYWTRSELEAAEDEMGRTLDPLRDHAGNWATFMRWNVERELTSLHEELADLDVESPSGRRRYNELRGERRVLQRLRTKDLGLSKAFRNELEQAKTDRSQP